MLLEAWNAFFHADAPATTVAVFRIAIAAMLLVNASLMAPDLAYLYGPRGVTGEANRSGWFGDPKFSLLRLMPDSDRAISACFVVHVIAVAALLAGALTPISAAIAYATLLALHSRNPLVTYGGDAVLRTMCFLLIFAPAGADLSVDSLLATGRWRNTSPVDVWAWRLMQVQVAVIYLKACAAKLPGRTWRDGRAVYYATEVMDFQRHRLPVWARRASWCRLTAWGTLIVEGAMGSIVWFAPLRAAVVVAAAGMHLALEYFLNVHLFGAAMLSCLVLFVDPARLNQWLAAAGLA